MRHNISRTTFYMMFVYSFCKYSQYTYIAVVAQAAYATPSLLCDVVSVPLAPPHQGSPPAVHHPSSLGSPTHRIQAALLHPHHTPLFFELLAPVWFWVCYLLEASLWVISLIHKPYYTCQEFNSKNITLLTMRHNVHHAQHCSALFSHSLQSLLDSLFIQQHHNCSCEHNITIPCSISSQLL